MLTAQYTVPLACVADWNVPEIESAEKELPVMEEDVYTVVVDPVGQFDPRFG
jgi:hypothetical protein